MSRAHMFPRKGPPLEVVGVSPRIPAGRPRPNPKVPAAPPAPDSITPSINSAYEENLKKQIYFLELEVKYLKEKMASEAAAAQLAAQPSPQAAPWPYSSSSPGAAATPASGTGFMYPFYHAYPPFSTSPISNDIPQHADASPPHPFGVPSTPFAPATPAAPAATHTQPIPPVLPIRPATTHPGYERHSLGSNSRHTPCDAPPQGSGGPPSSDIDTRTVKSTSSQQPTVGYPPSQSPSPSPVSMETDEQTLPSIPSRRHTAGSLAASTLHGPASTHPDSQPRGSVSSQHLTPRHAPSDASPSGVEPDVQPRASLSSRHPSIGDAPSEAPSNRPDTQHRASISSLPPTLEHPPSEVSSNPTDRQLRTSISSHHPTPRHASISSHPEGPIGSEAAGNTIATLSSDHLTPRDVSSGAPSQAPEAALRPRTSISSQHPMLCYPQVEVPRQESNSTESSPDGTEPLPEVQGSMSSRRPSHTQSEAQSQGPVTIGPEMYTCASVSSHPPSHSESPSEGLPEPELSSRGHIPSEGPSQHLVGPGIASHAGSVSSYHQPQSSANLDSARSTSSHAPSMHPVSTQTSFIHPTGPQQVTSSPLPIVEQVIIPSLPLSTLNLETPRDGMEVVPTPVPPPVCLASASTSVDLHMIESFDLPGAPRPCLISASTSMELQLLQSERPRTPEPPPPPPVCMMTSSTSMDFPRRASAFTQATAIPPPKSVATSQTPQLPPTPLMHSAIQTHVPHAGIGVQVQCPSQSATTQTGMPQLIFNGTQTTPHLSPDGTPPEVASDSLLPKLVQNLENLQAADLSRGFVLEAEELSALSDNVRMLKEQFLSREEAHKAELEEERQRLMQEKQEMEQGYLMQLEAQRREMQRQIEILTEEKSAANEEAVAEIVQLQKMIETDCLKITALDTELQAAIETKDNQLVELHRLNDHIKNLEQQVSNEQASHRRLMQDLQTSQEQLTSAKVLLKEYKALAPAGESLEITHLRQQLIDVEGEQRQLALKLKQVTFEKAQEVDRNQKLDEQVRELMDAHVHHQQKEMKWTKQKGELETQCVKLAAEVKELEDQKAAIETELALLKVEVQDQAVQLAQVTEQRDSQEGVVTEKDLQIHRLNEALQRVKKELASREEHYSSLDGDNAALRKENRLLREEVATVKRTLQEWKARCEELEAIANERQAAIDHHEKQVAMLRRYSEAEASQVQIDQIVHSNVRVAASLQNLMKVLPTTPLPPSPFARIGHPP